jgi:hypothetical protein
MFQNFQLLPIGNLADVVGYGGDAVLKVHLSGRDVDGFMPLVT